MFHLNSYEMRKKDRWTFSSTINNSYSLSSMDLSKLF